jgi:hypothetical protein
VDSNQKHRHVIDARRPIQYGGGACNLLLRGIDGHVELLFHATPQTGAVMTRVQALELARALTRVAESPQTAAAKPSGMPQPRLLVRRPGDCRSGPGGVLDAVGSARIDKRRWWVFFTGHLTTVIRQ